MPRARSRRGQLASEFRPPTQRELLESDAEMIARTAIRTSPAVKAMEREIKKAVMSATKRGMRKMSAKTRRVRSA